MGEKMLGGDKEKRRGGGFKMGDRGDFYRERGCQRNG